MPSLVELIDYVDKIVWSNALIFLCIFCGLYFSIRLGFPQVTQLKDMVKLMFQGEKSDKGITPFQAFALAVSGRVGTGNIAGVATAIGLGGPGAIFWMWITAFFGSASAFVESVLGQMYKEEKDGEYRGGPAYYILRGLNSKAFAMTFAFVTILSTGLLLPGVQSNSISASINSAFSIDPKYTSIFLVLILGVIIIGGVKRISKVAEFIVPIMAGAYILMAIVIIGLNITEVPAVFNLIIQSALSTDATFGGIVGSAIALGVKRGIYSNEAGQGTAPAAAAAAETSHPVKQGLVQAFSVYVDTLLVCTATALMILFTNQYNVKHPDTGTFIVEHIPGVEIGAEFTQYAVGQHFPSIGSPFVAIALTLFAFTTVMAYYYIAETNISFLLKQNKSKLFIWILRICILAAVYIGCITTAKTAWSLGDIGVGLMAWLNLIAIILLHKKVLILYKDYKEQLKAGKDPVFDNSKYNFPNIPLWNSNPENDKITKE